MRRKNFSSPTRWHWDNLKSGDGALEQGRDAGEGGNSELTRGGILVIAQPLERFAEAEVVDAMGELYIVRISKQVAAIPGNWKRCWYRPR